MRRLLCDSSFRFGNPLHFASKQAVPDFAHFLLAQGAETPDQPSLLPQVVVRSPDLPRLPVYLEHGLGDTFVIGLTVLQALLHHNLVLQGVRVCLVS